MSQGNNQQAMVPLGGRLQPNNAQRAALNAVALSVQQVAQAFAPPPPIQSIWEITVGLEYDQLIDLLQPCSNGRLSQTNALSKFCA